MKNLQKGKEPAGEQMNLFSLAGSRDLANHTQPQANDLEKKMTVTSGRRCLERYEKFSRHGSWAKMFSDLLIGMEGWYSTKCRLIWKLKGTKYNRMYFQLVPSTLPTDEIGFGLLLTPTVTEIGISENRIEKRTAYRESIGRKYVPGNLLEQIQGMLPTPTAMEYKDAQLTVKQAKELDKGGRVLRRLGTMNLLEDGETSHKLNPQFVGEMMGFLPSHTELPFQKIETTWTEV